MSNSVSLASRARMALKLSLDLIRGDGDAIANGAGVIGALFPSSRGDPPKRGTAELLQAYSTMPWLRAVTQKISLAVAQMSWRMYAIRDNKGKYHKATNIQTTHRFEDRQKLLQQHDDIGELVEITDHPMLHMLQNANRYHTGINARRLLQTYLDLTGEFFILYERDPQFGIPTAFWPLPTNWVQETPTPKNPVYNVALGGQFPVDIPMTEILWATDPDPANPYGRGSALSATLGDELDTMEFTAKTLKSHFLNRGRPDFVASVMPRRGEDEVGMTQLKRLQEKWMQEHRGFFRFFKPHFINRELKIHEFQQDFRRQQLIPIMEHERDTVIQVFGFPPEVFGVLESSNRATIAAADYFFARYSVLPRLEFQREVFQRHVVPIYDDRIILHFDNPVMEDEEFKLKAAQAAPWVLTKAEWQKLMGLPRDESDPEADVHMVSNTLIGTRSLLEVGDNAPPVTE